MVSRIFEPSRVWRDSTNIKSRNGPAVLTSHRLAYAIREVPNGKGDKVTLCGDFFGFHEGWDGLNMKVFLSL